jgi:glycosyltransferase involved in cell wall biosynthesis
MKQARIGLILPAYNLEADVAQSFSRIAAGVAEFPQHEFVVYAVDDGSTDSTYATLQEAQAHSNFSGSILRNETNLGLVQTLKNTYQIALDDAVTHILKTDLDADFDQQQVLRRMVPYIERGIPIASAGTQVVAGVRWREITEQENTYEFERRVDILRVLDAELGIRELDPPSCGTQLYEATALNHILAHPRIVAHTQRWGLDFLIPLVAKSEHMAVAITRIEKGRYDPARRPADKVRAQYDTYLEVIGSLVGKTPQELSVLYKQ